MGTRIQEIEGGITAVQGIDAGGIRCGIKEEGEDLAIILSQGEVAAAATFTTNAIKAAPVILSRDMLLQGSPRGIVANSGNANACTGERGLRDAREMSETTARCLGLPVGSILVASTGLIGEYLPLEMILGGINDLAPTIGPHGGDSAARAILTTDTVPKTAALEFSVENSKIRIGGMAKGAGMIFPRMATMLSFIATDAAIEKEALQSALSGAVERSFNRITVDGDTSTNDCVFLLANGLSGNPPLKEGDACYRAFLEALETLCLSLAKMLVKDGEGATKFIEVTVKEAQNEEDALAVARAVANSPLVKTACYGEDPNWGRIMAVAGSTGRRMDVSKMALYLGDVRVVDQGLKARGEWREAAEKEFKKGRIAITLHLGVGGSECTVWGTDLTEEYIKINADYHT